MTSNVVNICSWAKCRYDRINFDAFFGSRTFTTNCHQMRFTCPRSLMSSEQYWQWGKLAMDIKWFAKSSSWKHPKRKNDPCGFCAKSDFQCLWACPTNGPAAPVQEQHQALILITAPQMAIQQLISDLVKSFKIDLVKSQQFHLALSSQQFHCRL